MRTGGFSLNRLTFAAAPATSADGEADASDFGLEVGPNPARDRIGVVYRLATPGPADVSVFDALGRRVALLVSGPAAAGKHRAELATDALTPGLFIVVLTTEQGQRSEQVAVVR